MRHAIGLNDVREIVLVHDSLALTGDKASRDVIDQMDAVERVARDLGITVSRLPVDLNLWNFKKRLHALKPGLVFNLVESLDRSDRLQTIVPLLLEDWRIPFTGCGSMGMHLANHKLAAKEMLLDKGLPAPAGAWRSLGGVLNFMPGGEETRAAPGAWIVKTVESHASLHLDDSSVMAPADNAALAQRLEEAENVHGQGFFAEKFIDGREFNLSLLENDDDEIEVLPPAEISFADLPDGKPRIVGYAAKWEEGSAEHRATPRVFPGPGERPLLDKLSFLAVSAWKLFNLSGYARIDFRVDREGNPYILEANANPCITPDAGFAAAAERGGLSYRDMIVRIMEAGLRRG